MFMLIDSRSSHSFIDEQLSSKLAGMEILKTPLQVQIAYGG